MSDYESNFCDPDGDPIRVVEYRKSRRGWKPFSVETSRSTYDCDWCEQDGVLAVHESGGGLFGDTHELGSYRDALCAKIWHAPSCQLTHNKNLITDREARALGYQVVPEPIGGNPFDDPDLVDDDTEYCEQCRDRHPCDSICGHILHEEGVGWTLGCGAPEVDFAKTQASLYRLLRMLSPKEIADMRKRAVNRTLTENDPGGLLDRFADERRYEERYWPGIAWLASLDSSCREAMALTAGWLWMFERLSWRACCILPEHVFIRHLPKKQLAEWLALDPLKPELLHGRPLRVKLGFRSRSANDAAFLKDPLRCHEVTLWPPAGTDGVTICANNLTLSVAEVKYVSAKTVDVFFGAVITRNGVHISEIRERAEADDAS